MNAGTSFKTYSTTGVTSSSGFSVAVSTTSDSVFATNAIDGSTLESTFSPNFTTSYIVLDSNTDFTGIGAYAYYCYTLTTANGMYLFWDGVTALDVSNYRINTSTLNLYFDESAGFVKQTDSVRVFRSDGARPVLDPTTGAAGVEMNWRNPVYAYDGGGGGFTSGDRATLESRSSHTAAAAATAVLSAAQSAPIYADVRKVVGTTITGTGTEIDPWGP